jgi:putative methyltransferase (TIGR01177 family)
MTYIVRLLNDHPEIGHAELESLLQTPLQRIEEYCFVEKIAIEQFKRLSFAHDLLHIIQFPLQNPTYKIQFAKKQFTAEQKKQWYKKIFAQCVNPTIDMNASLVIEVLNIQDTTYITQVLCKNPKEYLSQKPHTRLARHPSSITHKFSRAMINLTGLQSGTILDPFCGTGGILIEATLVGFHASGIDIEPAMVEGCLVNAKQKNMNITVTCADALTQTYTADAIVTDMPYGKNTKNVSMSLYEKFVEHLAQTKFSGPVVVCLPHWVAFEDICKKHTVTIEYHFTHYIHASLTRHIYKIRVTSTKCPHNK